MWTYHPVVSAFCPRCGPAPRWIIRGRDLIFLSRAQGVSLFPELWRPIAFCAMLAASFSVGFHIELLQQGLLCQHTLPYGNDFGWYCWQPRFTSAVWNSLKLSQPWSSETVQAWESLSHCSKPLFHSPSLCLFLLQTQFVSYLYM